MIPTVGSSLKVPSMHTVYDPRSNFGVLFSTVLHFNVSTFGNSFVIIRRFKRALYMSQNSCFELCFKFYFDLKNELKRFFEIYENWKILFVL